MHQRAKKYFVFSLLFYAAACSTNPVTGKSELHVVSEQQEVGIGEANYLFLQQAEGGEYVADKSITTYVRHVGNKLADVSDRPHLPYAFVVVNNSEPNAWSLPGGKIAINRGLLAELHNEAELAAVLSHEIVHSAARHGAQNVERSLLMSAGLIGLQETMKDRPYADVVVGSAALGAGLIALSYSRGAELEADRYGIDYMVRAGYDPEAAVALQRTFLRLSEEQDPQWLGGLFATHPPSEERLEANAASVRAYPQQGRLGASEYAIAMETLWNTQAAYEDLDAGYAALQAQDPREALRLAEAGIAIAPKEGHLYNLKGKAEVELCLYRDALESFTQAIARNPDYFDYYLQRGRLRNLLGDPWGAREDLTRSAALFPPTN
jgi:predicted Zn-dependent protease